MSSGIGLVPCGRRTCPTSASHLTRRIEKEPGGETRIDDGRVGILWDAVEQRCRVVTVENELLTTEPIDRGKATHTEWNDYPANVQCTFAQKTPR